MNAIAYRLWLPAVFFLVAGRSAKGAQDTEDHAGAHDAETMTETAHSSSGGMPQLDPEWFASQIFWMAATFLGLYFIFARKVLPELSSIIEARRERIQDDLDKAQQLRDDAEEVHAAYEEILAEARETASGLFLKMEEEIRTNTNDRFSTFQEKATAEIKKAEQKIEKSKKEAMKDMDSIAAEVAAEAAARIVGITPDVSRAKIVIQNMNKKAA